MVDGLNQAIEHINHYGSHHTDSIISEHQGEARQFMAEVDSASVMLNTPTCFADGFEYGWVRKSVFPPTSCMPAALSVWKA